MYSGGGGCGLCDYQLSDCCIVHDVGEGSAARDRRPDSQPHRGHSSSSSCVKSEIGPSHSGASSLGFRKPPRMFRIWQNHEILCVRKNECFVKKSGRKVLYIGTIQEVRFENSFFVGTPVFACHTPQLLLDSLYSLLMVIAGSSTMPQFFHCMITWGK